MEKEGINYNESVELETLRKLEQYVADGYLLHGSKSRIEILEPRQANDMDKSKIARNQVGIYATSKPEIAISVALMQGAVPSGHTSYFHHNESEDGSKSFEIGGKNITLRSGYVHVLPKDSFEEIRHEDDIELISKVPVKPVDVVEVSPNILRYVDVKLGGDLEGYFEK